MLQYSRLEGYFFDTIAYLMSRDMLYMDNGLTDDVFVLWAMMQDQTARGFIQEKHGNMYSVLRSE